MEFHFRGSGSKADNDKRAGIKFAAFFVSRWYFIDSQVLIWYK
jgi:hypothetical protein